MDKILDNEILLKSVKKFLINQRNKKLNELDDINIININEIIKQYNIKMDDLYYNYYIVIENNIKNNIIKRDKDDILKKYNCKLQHLKNKYEYFILLGEKFDTLNEQTFFNIQINKYLNKIKNI